MSSHPPSFGYFRFNISYAEIVRVSLILRIMLSISGKLLAQGKFKVQDYLEFAGPFEIFQPILPRSSWPQQNSYLYFLRTACLNNGGANFQSPTVKCIFRRTSFPRAIFASSARKGMLMEIVREPLPWLL